MASQYFAILTDYGTRAIAHALSQGQPLQLTKFAVGDGNGKAVTPTANATSLVHQTHIAPVSAVSLDPRNNKQVIVELTIPENVGGFYIREMGVFDAQNKLIAYANCPESFKPTESSGSGKVQVLRMILKVESSSAVTLSIDNSVIFVTRQQMAPKTITATTQNGFDDSGHSHEINKASTSQQGIVQLTNDTGLESESLALTAKAGKKLAKLIATVQLTLNNYIPLNKRSSEVNSNDENNVATSKAVKTAYDKGVEAKTAADNAQRSANDGINRANNAQSSANDGINRANNAQSSANEANNNANGRVSKSGDTMTGNLTVPNIIVNDPTNNNNSVQIGDDTKLIDVDMGHTVGLQATDNANDAYIAYGATKKRFGFDGVNFSAESGLFAQWFGTPKRGEGAYANQWRTEAPYHVQAGNANGSNTYFPYLKGKVTNGDGWGSAFSFGYTTPGERNQFGTGIIHLIEDNGAERKWKFAHNGDFISDGDVRSSSGKSINDSVQTSAISHITNGTAKNKVASEFALGELNKRMDKLINESIYHKHYDGAKVLRLRVDNNGGWKIIKMKASRINVPSNGEVILNLPEAITMDSVITATDDGSAKYSYGAVMMSATTIKIFAIAGRTIGINITIMGGGAF